MLTVSVLKLMYKNVGVEILYKILKLIYCVRKINYALHTYKMLFYSNKN